MRVRARAGLRWVIALALDHADEADGLLLLLGEVLLIEEVRRDEQHLALRVLHREHVLSCHAVDRVALLDHAEHVLGRLLPLLGHRHGLGR